MQIKTKVTGGNQGMGNLIKPTEKGGVGERRAF